ncbi:MAG TPA: biotin/lipoyl-containing protein, partial [Actinomycetes bacterium]|nr:biotin/lipoyl-containing protein [Actinomycetes bacterium]
MTQPVEVPDIGDFADIPIIEIHVGSGDTVDVDDPLITLESDKATMDVPSPAAGAITDVLVKVGDTVSQGTRIAMLQPGDGALKPPTSLVDQQEPPPAETEEVVAAAKESAAHNVEPAPGESPAGVAA